MKMASVVLLALMLSGCAMQGPDAPAGEQREERSLFLGCTEHRCARAR